MRSVLGSSLVSFNTRVIRSDSIPGVWPPELVLRWLRGVLLQQTEEVGENLVDGAGTVEVAESGETGVALVADLEAGRVADQVDLAVVHEGCADFDQAALGDLAGLVVGDKQMGVADVGEELPPHWGVLVLGHGIRQVDPRGPDIQAPPAEGSPKRGVLQLGGDVDVEWAAEEVGDLALQRTHPGNIDDGERMVDAGFVAAFAGVTWLGVRAGAGDVADGAGVGRRCAYVEQGHIRVLSVGLVRSVGEEGGGSLWCRSCVAPGTTNAIIRKSWSTCNTPLGENPMQS